MAEFKRARTGVVSAQQSLLHQTNASEPPEGLPHSRMGVRERVRGVLIDPGDRRDFSLRMPLWRALEVSAGCAPCATVQARLRKCPTIAYVGCRRQLVAVGRVIGQMLGLWLPSLGHYRHCSGSPRAPTPCT